MQSFHRLKIKDNKSSRNKTNKRKIIHVDVTIFGRFPVGRASGVRFQRETFQKKAMSYIVVESQTAGGANPSPMATRAARTKPKAS